MLVSAGNGTEIVANAFAYPTARTLQSVLNSWPIILGADTYFVIF